MSDICAKCGLPEYEHHQFVALQIPAGCKCNPREWQQADGVPQIPEVCPTYVHDPEYDTCVTCQHPKDCHA